MLINLLSSLYSSKTERIFSFILFDHVCDELRIRNRFSTENAFKMFKNQPNRLLNHNVHLKFTNVLRTHSNMSKYLFENLFFFFRTNMFTVFWTLFAIFKWTVMSISIKWGKISTVWTRLVWWLIRRLLSVIMK